MKAFLFDIGKRENNEGNQTFSILYTDEISQKFVKNYSRLNFNLDILKQIARVEVSNLIAEPPIVDLKNISIGMEIDTSIIPPIPFTPEEIARNEFLKSWRLYQSMLRAVSGGLLDITDKTITDIKDFLIKNFLVSYLEFM